MNEFAGGDRHAKKISVLLFFPLCRQKKSTTKDSHNGCFTTTLCLDTEQDLTYCLYRVGLRIVQLEAFVTSRQYRLNPTEYPLISSGGGGGETW
jgi:hypothetical protein